MVSPTECSKDWWNCALNFPWVQIRIPPGVYFLMLALTVGIILPLGRKVDGWMKELHDSSLTKAFTPIKPVGATQ